MSKKLTKEAGRELARAQASLKAARVLLAERLHEDSVSRAYYAVLHSAKAGLISLGISVASLRAARTMFSLHMVKPRLIEAEFSKMFAAEKEDRELAEYSTGSEIGKAVAELRVREAARFVERIEQFLAEKQSGQVKAK